jgi:hypothetical protein
VLKLCSSCWSLYLLREEFLSAPIHTPLFGLPFWSFSDFLLDGIPLVASEAEDVLSLGRSFRVDNE